MPLFLCQLGVPNFYGRSVRNKASRVVRGPGNTVTLLRANYWIFGDLEADNWVIDLVDRLGHFEKDALGLTCIGERKEPS